MMDAKKYVVVNWSDGTSSYHQSEKLHIDENMTVTKTMKNEMWKGVVDTFHKTRKDAITRHNKLCGSINSITDKGTLSKEERRKAMKKPLQEIDNIDEPRMKKSKTLSKKDDSVAKDQVKKRKGKPAKPNAKKEALKAYEHNIIQSALDNDKEEPSVRHVVAPLSSEDPLNPLNQNLKDNYNKNNVNKVTENARQNMEPLSTEITKLSCSVSAEKDPSENSLSGFDIGNSQSSPCDSSTPASVKTGNSQYSSSPIPTGNNSNRIKLGSHIALSPLSTGISTKQANIPNRSSPSTDLTLKGNNGLSKVSEAQKKQKSSYGIVNNTTVHFAHSSATSTMPEKSFSYYPLPQNYEQGMRSNSNTHVSSSQEKNENSLQLPYSNVVGSALSTVWDTEPGGFKELLNDEQEEHIKDNTKENDTSQESGIQSINLDEFDEYNSTDALREEISILRNKINKLESIQHDFQRVFAGHLQECGKDFTRDISGGGDKPLNKNLSKRVKSSKDFRAAVRVLADELFSHEEKMSCSPCGMNTHKDTEPRPPLPEDRKQLLYKYLSVFFPEAKRSPINQTLSYYLKEYRRKISKRSSTDQHNENPSNDEQRINEQT